LVTDPAAALVVSGEASPPPWDADGEDEKEELWEDDMGALSDWGVAAMGSGRV
jgi:hypothetical protein